MLSFPPVCAILPQSHTHILESMLQCFVNFLWLMYLHTDLHSTALTIKIEPSTKFCVVAAEQKRCHSSKTLVIKAGGINVPWSACSKMTPTWVTTTTNFKRAEYSTIQYNALASYFDLTNKHGEVFGSSGICAETMNTGGD